MKRFLYILLIFPLLPVSCLREEDKVFYDEDQISIADYLEKNKETYSKFYRIVTEGGMRDPLSAYNPFGNGFTLFVPTDEAFDRYIEDHPSYTSFEEMMQDTDFVRLLGRYHLVNIQLETNEFPYGALPDTTASGDILTIGFSSELDSTVYKVNNEAPVLEGNIETINGYIHILGEVLQPVNFSGYQWIEQNPGYSILQQALSITGLKDTLGIFRMSKDGKLVANKYTLLVEHDSIYRREGINSIDDLVARYATPGLDITDPDNALYQFAAYHILEGSYFLVDFDQSGNYNTYANSPIRFVAGLEVRINPGVDTFRLEISEFGDTTAITYVSLYYQESNILTKNGAVHFLTEVTEYYTPPVSARTFSFYEEPEILAVRNTPGTYFFDEAEQEEQFGTLRWQGPEFLTYFKSSSTSEPADNDDYIELEGNFTISYTLPKILPGKYVLFIKAHGLNNNNEHATVIVYLDGKRMGNAYNLNTGGRSANPYQVAQYKNVWEGYHCGTVEFNRYIEHTVTIESMIPGILRWDNIRFVPE
jgi:uncharacterized surface protein with fasciclin (FAS1) repeats